MTEQDDKATGDARQEFAMPVVDEEPSTGWMARISAAKLAVGCACTVIAFVASGAFYAGQRVTGLSDQIAHLADKIDSNAALTASALATAQKQGFDARLVLAERVGKLETREDHDDQTNREAAAAVAGLQGQMQGVQRSMDYLIALVQSRGAKLQQESMAGAGR